VVLPDARDPQVAEREALLAEPSFSSTRIDAEDAAAVGLVDPVTEVGVLEDAADQRVVLYDRKGQRPPLLGSERTARTASFWAPSV
jgi:hypothetical protein